MRHSTLWVLALSIWLVFAVGGCQAKRTAPQNLNTPVVVEAPISDDPEVLKKELANLRARERLVVGALEDAKNEALQFKIWIGVGALALAGMILVFLGVYTSRSFLLSLGVGAFGLAALGVLAAALVPYIFWIGLGVSALVIAAAVYMLLNREKGLRQLTQAVEDSKKRIPQFQDAYKDIFNGRIDTGVDTLLDSIRGVKK